MTQKNRNVLFEFGSLEVHVPDGVDLNAFTQGEARYIPDPDEPPLPGGHRRYRFDMRGADEAGEHRHPEVVIRELAPKAHSFQPESIGDCWFFSAPVIERLPGYVREVKT